MELPNLLNITLSVTRGMAESAQSPNSKIFIASAFGLGLLLGIMLESGVPFLAKLLLVGAIVSFVVFLWFSGALTVIVELVIILLILAFYFLKNVVLS